MARNPPPTSLPVKEKKNIFHLDVRRAGRKLTVWELGYEDTNWSTKIWIGVRGYELGYEDMNWGTKIWTGVRGYEFGYEDMNWGTNTWIGERKYELGYEDMNWGTKTWTGVRWYELGYEHMNWGTKIWFGVQGYGLGYEHMNWGTKIWNGSRRYEFDWTSPWQRQTEGLWQHCYEMSGLKPRVHLDHFIDNVRMTSRDCGHSQVVPRT